MYRSSLSSRDRAGSIVLVGLIHLGLAYALLNLSGTMRIIEQEIIPQLIDFDLEEPVPPNVEVPLDEDLAPEEEGAASPENIRSTATPVAAPKPRIVLPVPPPIPVTETPNTGSEPTQGAADRLGPGTGAGGIGTGTGAGGSGSGSGGGGAGEGRPLLLSGRFTSRDYPREIQRRWDRSQSVLVIFKVQLNGRVTDCRTSRSSGDWEIDRWTCRLAEERLVFRPAYNRRGEPYVELYGYEQRKIR